MIGAQFAQRRIGRQSAVDERSGFGGYQNLAAVADRQQSRDLIDRWTEVVARAHLYAAGMD